MTADSVLRARIVDDVKRDASAVLDRMGLSVSDAIRMLLVRVARDQKLPFDVNAPNEETLAAVRELNADKVRRAADVPQLLAQLNADD